ncbi:MAG TPA: GrpB family protein [Bacillota bacterium]
MRIVVVDYDPGWPGAFEREAAALRTVLGHLLAAIHHIGSTAVPGLKAKPVIDIMPVVTNISAVDLLAGRMRDLGYEAMGEAGIPGRRYFRKGPDLRTHNVHVFEMTNMVEIERHLAVRDYLRRHPDDAARYGALKAELAPRVNDDIYAYMDGKNDFVQALQRTALAWSRAGRP